MSTDAETGVGLEMPFVMHNLFCHHFTAQQSSITVPYSYYNFRSMNEFPTPSQKEILVAGSGTYQSHERVEEPEESR